MALEIVGHGEAHGSETILESSNVSHVSVIDGVRFEPECSNSWLVIFIPD